MTPMTHSAFYGLPGRGLENRFGTNRAMEKNNVEQTTK